MDLMNAMIFGAKPMASANRTNGPTHETKELTLPIKSETVNGSVKPERSIAAPKTGIDNSSLNRNYLFH
jgi:hypothetical protein